MGCDAPEEDASTSVADAPAGGKADDAGPPTITWHTLEATGCAVASVVNDPSGDAYASSWLFETAVERCSLSGSATLPAGVRVTQMVVQGRGFIVPSADVGGTASAVIDVRGTQGQSLILPERQNVTAGEEGADVMLDGLESLSGGCSSAPQTFRFSSDFAIGGGTFAQFDSLDVAFTVAPC